MRVFLAGASGVIGRPLIPALVAAGHEVTGITRRPERAEAIRAAGAEAVVCDVLDATAVGEAVGAAAPEAVIQHLTDLPPDLNPRNMKRAYAANDRLRTEGSKNLVAAALESGVRRYVAQNVCFFYAPEGGAVKEEGDRLFTDAPPPFDRSIKLAAEMEERVTRTPGLEGLVLRFGVWYGPATSFASDGFIANEVRRRRFPIVGAGTGINSFVHIDDVVEATQLALERGDPGMYNVCDDEPAPMAEWVPAYAEAIGARPPRRVPRWLARLVAGRYATYLATELRGASNAKAKREFGWKPRFESWRQGFFEGLG